MKILTTTIICFHVSRLHLKTFIIAAFISFALIVPALAIDEAKDYALAMKQYQKEDYAVALKGFQKLAESKTDLESDSSQFMLGEMNAKGQGVERDITQAYFWYYLVADEPHEGDHGPHAVSDNAPDLVKAHDALVVRSIKALEAVSKNMTKDQISEGQRLAIDWEFLNQN